MKGIAPKSDKMTFAAQYDICPHGRTYPRKPSAINKNNRKQPNNQTSSLGFW